MLTADAVLRMNGNIGILGTAFIRPLKEKEKLLVRWYIGVSIVCLKNNRLVDGGLLANLRFCPVAFFLICGRRLRETAYLLFARTTSMSFSHKSDPEITVEDGVLVG